MCWILVNVIILRSKNDCNEIGVYNANVLNEIVNLSILILDAITANKISSIRNNTPIGDKSYYVGRGGIHDKMLNRKKL